MPSVFRKYPNKGGSLAELLNFEILFYILLTSRDEGTIRNLELFSLLLLSDGDLDASLYSNITIEILK